MVNESLQAKYQLACGVELKIHHGAYHGQILTQSQ